MNRELLFINIYDHVMHYKQLEWAIGRAGLGQQWAGPKSDRTKIDPDFLGQNFNSLARPKNRADRAK